MSMKEIFLRRIQSVLYTRLREEKLKSWDSTQVYSLSNAIIKDNLSIVEKYLQENNVNLDNVQTAVQELVDKLLTEVKFK